MIGNDIIDLEGILLYNEIKYFNFTKIFLNSLHIIAYWQESFPKLISIEFNNYPKKYLIYFKTK